MQVKQWLSIFQPRGWFKCLSTELEKQKSMLALPFGWMQLKGMFILYYKI